MKVICCLLLFAVSVLSQDEKPHYDIKDAPALFEKFIKDHNRNYKDEADKAVHYQAFVKALEDINKSNADSSSATYDINEFTDYTSEEEENIFGFKENKYKNMKTNNNN